MLTFAWVTEVLPLLDILLLSQLFKRTIDISNQVRHSLSSLMCLLILKNIRCTPCWQIVSLTRLRLIPFLVALILFLSGYFILWRKVSAVRIWEYCLLIHSAGKGFIWDLLPPRQTNPFVWYPIVCLFFNVHSMIIVLWIIIFRWAIIYWLPECVLIFLAATDFSSNRFSGC